MDTVRLGFEDRFQVERLAGEGGMGAVYVAWDRVLGRRVAVKRLASTRPEDAARFDREVALLRALRHPGIVEYLAHGRDAAGRPFLAMEWVDGEDLAARLRRGRLGEAEALRVGAEVADALAAAHAQGVVHRDVKPANVLAAGGHVERVKVIDFGVARLEEGRLTVTGLTLGTPSYMAPEQARGDSDVGPAADVYGLGATVFECLTGRPPFEGAHAVAVLAKVILEPAPLVRELAPEVSPRVSALVARMLAKDPRERPRDGAEAAALLRAHGAVPAASTTSAPAASGALRAELRLVSVLLALRTVRADAAADATLASGEVFAELDRVRAVVAAHGAALEVLANGALLVTQEGGAAVDGAAGLSRCALAMRAAFPDLAIGIAVGRARVARQRPAGEAIDRAVALAQGPPRVRVDATTASLLGPRFTLGPEEGGGRELLHEAPDEPEDHCVRTRSSAYVGREREIGLLLGALEACADERAPRAVLVTAAAGMGKSRLRHELAARIAERHPSAQVWLGLGDPMRAGAPFAIVADALRRALDLAGDEGVDASPPGAARAPWWQRLSARVARRVTDDPARVAAFLAELLHVAPRADPFAAAGPAPTESLPPPVVVALRAAREDPLLLGDQMVRAAIDLMAAEAAAGPLVVMLDDLQWGDLPSVRLLDAALSRVDGSLLVLGFARPEIDTVFPRLFRDRGVLEVSLAPLGKRAAAELVEGLLGGGRAAGSAAPAALSASIVERGAGNAFYLEALARAASAGAAGLPDTVLAMAEARTADLSPEHRRLLRGASVFGHASTAAGIAALVGPPWSEESVAAALGDLSDAGVVERRRGARGDEITFRLPLVREAAYATMSDDDRRAAHAAAAAWLEGTGQRDPAILAEHLGRAGLRKDAVQHLIRAAEHALAGHDFDRVLVLAAQGAAADPERSVLGRIRLLEAEAQRWLGNFDDAEEAALAAVATLPPGSAAWFHAVEHVIGMSGRRGEFGIALEWEREALGVAVEPDAAGARLSCLCEAGRALFHAGFYAEAGALVARVQALAEAVAPPPRVQAEIERLAGARARHLGDVGLALVHYGRALEAFEATNDLRNAGNAHVSHAFANVEVGRWDVARRELERALAEADRARITSVVARARQNLGLVLVHDGAFAEAEASFDFAIAQARAHGNVRFEGWTLVYRSNARRLAGRAADAEADARRALSVLAVSPPARAGALAALSLALLDRGAAGEALAAAREALGVLAQFGGVEEFEPLVLLAHVRAAGAALPPSLAGDAAIDARRRILARAERISDPALRESFLRDVPENALLLRLAEGRRPASVTASR